MTPCCRSPVLSTRLQPARSGLMRNKILLPECANSYRSGWIYYTVLGGRIKGFTMKKNAVQFQKGCGLPAFFKKNGGLK